MRLPQSVQDIVGLLGVIATLTLVDAYGGTYLKVPLGKRPGKIMRDLVALLGEEKAGILMYHYGGERVSMPRCEAALRGARNREIIAKYDSGISAPRLAREYKMTERNIRTILKTVPECTEGIA